MFTTISVRNARKKLAFFVSCRRMSFHLFCSFDQFFITSINLMRILTSVSEVTFAWHSEGIF